MVPEDWCIDFCPDCACLVCAFRDMNPFTGEYPYQNIEFVRVAKLTVLVCKRMPAQIQ